MATGSVFLVSMILPVKVLIQRPIDVFADKG